MGPRLFSRGDQNCVSGCWSRNRLQWGHGFSAVETVTGRADAADPVSASMGPRLFSRGDVMAARSRRVPCSRFNGATAFQPWRRYFRGTLLGGQAGFNGATAFQPWRRPSAAAPRRSASRFNGATAFQPWRQANKVAPAGGNALQWGHGFSAVETAMATLALNAMSMLQWGHGFSAVETPRLYSLSFRS